MGDFRIVVAICITIMVVGTAGFDALSKILGGCNG